LREDPKHILNSTLNSSPILSSSNRRIGAKNFEDYKTVIQPLSKVNHSLPDFIERQGFDAIEKYYEKFLELRYEKLKGSILEKLSRFK
jgi:N-methylhydantoinase B/oxoprolinase/acetone carboxylase alpha subunit